MPFHPDPDLRAAFQGYQGPDPAGCRLIFVGKDANYPPLPPLEQQQRASVLAYLRNHEWRQQYGPFRRSRLYKNRNKNLCRAHHPLLLKCFPGGKGGAPYHRTMARLFDRIIYRLQAAGQNGLAADLVTTHCSFVELIRFPTTGNNGDVVRKLFQGEVPQGWEDGAGFSDQQTRHREKTLPKWLLNSQRAPNGNPSCTAVLPQSVFEVLCEFQWQGLNGEHLNHVSNWFAGNPGECVCHLAGFGDREWLITAGFPYFSHFAGWHAPEIAIALDQLAKQLTAVLRQ